MDIKTVLVRDVDAVLPPDANATVLSIYGGTVYQGILRVTTPGDPVLRACIAHMLQTPQFRVNVNYLFTCKHMYDRICDEVGSSTLRVGLNGRVGGPRWRLLEERCLERGEEGCLDPDQYSKCCTIVDSHGSVCFGTRDPDFPWKKAGKKDEPED